MTRQGNPGGREVVTAQFGYQKLRDLAQLPRIAADVFLDAGDNAQAHWPSFFAKELAASFDALPPKYERELLKELRRRSDQRRTRERVAARARMLATPHGPESNVTRDGSPCCDGRWSDGLDEPVWVHTAECPDR